jgi:hypothetical protein
MEWLQSQSGDNESAISRGDIEDQTAADSSSCTPSVAVVQEVATRIARALKSEELRVGFLSASVRALSSACDSPESQQPTVNSPESYGYDDFDGGSEQVSSRPEVDEDDAGADDGGPLGSLLKHVFTSLQAGHSLQLTVAP